MLTDRDVLGRSSLREDGTVVVPDGVLVDDAMTPHPLETCEASTPVSDLARIMTEKKIDAIPVVRGLHLIGLVTSTDLLELLIDREEARAVPFDYRLLEGSSAYA
jgi:CBS domain-containing protein